MESETRNRVMTYMGAGHRKKRGRGKGRCHSRFVKPIELTEVRNDGQAVTMSNNMSSDDTPFDIDELTSEAYWRESQRRIDDYVELVPTDKQRVALNLYTRGDYCPDIRKAQARVRTDYQDVVQAGLDECGWSEEDVQMAIAAGILPMDETRMNGYGYDIDDYITAADDYDGTIYRGFGSILWPPVIGNDGKPRRTYDMAQMEGKCIGDVCDFGSVTSWSASPFVAQRFAGADAEPEPVDDEPPRCVLVADGSDVNSALVIANSAEGLETEVMVASDSCRFIITGIVDRGNMRYYRLRHVHDKVSDGVRAVRHLRELLDDGGTEADAIRRRINELYEQIS